LSVSFIFVLSLPGWLEFDSPLSQQRKALFQHKDNSVKYKPAKADTRQRLPIGPRTKRLRAKICAKRITKSLTYNTHEF